MVEASELRKIQSLSALIRFLKDKLEWPIEGEDVDEPVFDYEPEELHLDPKHCAKIKAIKQIRPIRIDQPWGVFWIEFESKRLPVVVLRHILSKLVINRRGASKSSERAAWKLNDLLFISAHGEKGGRGLTFAHFRDRGDNKPHLRTVGMDEGESAFHLEFNQRIHIEQLKWPDDPSDRKAWEEQWGSAFRAGHGETIRTAKDLAVRLALLAQRTRGLIAELFDCESDSGPLHKLFDSFRASLVHDMTPEQFADMYAQTLAYGIFSAKASGESVFGMADLEEIVPATNPFLKRLFKEFVSFGERKKQKIDFDGLGVGEIVELLDHAVDLKDIFEDFGRQSGGGTEDPVVHFYENFLTIYDKKQKKGRGVYYTPKPVVSFIVRSVDDILRKEFGLADGLADTTTWGEMAKRNPKVKLPVLAKPGDPFVRILDPATGTGTFLDTAIEVIFETLRGKWMAAKMSEVAQHAAWNEYVPKHLLPRLFGFELMMAPYAVCHMKLAYTLKKTGYEFKSDERLRVYLTNSLEPTTESEKQLKFLPEFMASETRDANVVKSRVPVTVVVGNPPYSGVSSNMLPWIDGLLKGMLPDGTKVQSYYEVDGLPLGERKLWLQDDYVKFLRYGQWRIESAECGILGMITNHGYLDNPTFRGMRQQLMATFPVISVIDLHGNAKKKERPPDGGEDKNVFDIEQGVGIGLMRRGGSAPVEVKHADLWGARESKYEALRATTVEKILLTALTPNSPFYFFVRMDETGRDEYEAGLLIPQVLPINTTGIVTARDGFVIDFDESALLDRIAKFKDTRYKDGEIREMFFAGKGSSKYPDGDSRGWKVPSARKLVREDRNWKRRVAPCLYRPFDVRQLYNVTWMVDWPRPEVMRHMLAGMNVGIYSCRQIVSDDWCHIFPTTTLTDDCYVSNKTRERGYLFPLYCYPTDKPSTLFELDEKTDAPGGRRPNLAPAFTDAFAKHLALSFIQDGRGDLTATFGPEDIFHFIYAQFHSPTYRTRYAEFLKRDFPRIFITAKQNLFRDLCRLGADLIALHLTEPEYPAASWNHPKSGVKNPFAKPLAPFKNSGKPEVAKGFPKYDDGAVFINETDRFTHVPEEVWNFQVGGYQVCAKWLKDRRGRKLSDEDIAHYRNIVTALHETLRLMAAIDKAIASHGDWPDAFVKEKI